MKTRILVKLLLSFMFISLSQANGLTAEQPEPGTVERYVKFDPEYSYRMMDSTTQITEKQRHLFNHKSIYTGIAQLILGGSITGLLDYQSSNTDSKFGYLMRHPTSRNQIGKNVSEAVVHSAQLQVTAVLTDWFASYAELLYNPQQNFGAGTITSIDRNKILMRKAFALFGNKGVFPVYFSLGKQDVPFGNMDTVNPFTSSSTWHAFGVLAYSAILGLDYKGIHAHASAIQGGAQFRAANVPVAGTSVPSRLNNFAVDAGYTYRFSDQDFVKAGASYLHGSSYNQAFPVMHFNPGVIINPAWDIYAHAKFKNFEINAEFAKTLKKWPGTHNPTAPLNIFSASKVSSLKLGAAYTFKSLFANSDLKLSFEYSDFKAGAKNSPWERQLQFVGGVSLVMNHNFKVFAEYVRAVGFVPLNGISGDLPGMPGTTISDRNSVTNVFLLGVQASL